MRSSARLITVPILTCLAVLLAACGGGGEEARNVLALAIRLDEGSPVMVAYSGDPDEGPLWLPAGRYYVEALDEDDVAVSLGSVDIDAGDAVDFPASFPDAGGAANPDRAASLVAIANFAVDVELSKYTLLEIVSGGFNQSLFDPAIESTAADFDPLFTIHGHIVDQEDTILDAIGEMQDRAQVSSGVPYVNPDWMPRLQESNDEEDAAEKAAFLIDTIGRVIMADEEDRPDVIAEQFLDLAESQNDFEARLARPWATVDESEELRGKQAEWREYAQELARRVSEADDEAGRRQAQAELAKDIRNDLEEWLEAHGAEVAAPHVDRAVDILAGEVFRSTVGPADLEPAWIGGYVQALYDQWIAEGYEDWVAAKEAADLRTCLREEVAAGSNRMEALSECPLSFYWPAGTPAATPSPTPTEAPGETPAPTPDTGWIEGYVQGIADGWLAAGYGGIDVAVAADDLRQCLVDAVQGGAGRDAAVGECPTWLFEPGGTPQPTSAATQTRTPGPLTARGKFTFSVPGQTDTENTMTLVWNESGGPIVSGEGRRRTEWSAACGTEWSSFSRQYTGTYDPGSRTFAGTYSGTWESRNWYLDNEGKCAEDKRSGTDSGDWAAVWQDGTATSTAGSDFLLTVEES